MPAPHGKGEKILTAKEDYRVTVKVRNALLLRAIEQAGFQPGGKFAALAGVSYNHLVGYVNLARSPYTEDGMIRPCAEKLCLFLNRMPCDLWSEDQLYPLEANTAEFEFSGEDMQGLLAACSAADPAVLLEQREDMQLLDEVLDSLPSPRMGAVLRMRNGLEGDEMGLGQTAATLGVSRERARQIEARGLRSLRAPERVKILKRIAR